MKDFLIKLASYCFLIILIANTISFAANYFLKKSSFYKSSYILREFPEGQEFDFIIAGSSRGLTSLDTKLIDSLINGKGFNLSLDDTGLPSHFLMLKHYFESGFKAKKCILVLDQNHFEKSETSLNENDYRMAAFSGEKYMKAYFKEKEKGLLKPLFLIPYFPMVAYSYYNSELFVSAIIGAVKPSYRHRFDEYGDYTYPTMISGAIEEEEPNSETKQTKITNPLINEVAAYLKQFDCDLILYIAPYKNMKFEIKNSVSYPVINHSDVLKNSSFFYDEIHVNLAGKEAATIVFSEEFKDLLGSE